MLANLQRKQDILAHFGRNILKIDTQSLKKGLLGNINKPCKIFIFFKGLKYNAAHLVWCPCMGLQVKENMCFYLGITFSFWQCRMSWIQSCPTLCDPVDCSLPGSSIHGILQARVLEWVAISFSRGSFRPRDRTQFSLIEGRCLNLWATREAPLINNSPHLDNVFPFYTPFPNFSDLIYFLILLTPILWGKYCCYLSFIDVAAEVLRF